ncbi:SUMO-activating enzyme subunit 1, putative [Plasmodium yoelii]|uniref:SUMO-activating enzyme subunit 1 n=2 Tax=Plasmodium yoelii TaxID=5861 RepID=A0AAE9WQH7_PLAYO|nr:SUMO-activating enzyme subunit 1, putative [Plasmodium yoelii]WBY57141.1 SUMO-activating enzyme subunit 1 [Plasmodium yoelii yoelii]CDU17834.1 ubiquitin activating enzyme (E1) subunit Aos1, putative [Plasmodium yoelii]VTZ78251.1 SUMO-activating enzyme subunit 1, putative [Plasmodium yoelii]|eukprot:XP_730886.2 SUMO-activating enzyme subunit 1, putative [Plasmodium yoelii]
MENSGEYEKEKIYDRQLRLWGVKAQNRMLKSNVLIVGLSGINIEICKNLILSGINITIIDDNVINDEMIESIFFLSEEDINKHLCLPIFRELKSINQLINIKGYIGRIDISNDCIVIDNEYIYKKNEEINCEEKNDDEVVAIEVKEKSFSIEEYISNYTCVCISCEDYPLYELIKINELCHKNNIGFFSPMCNGKFAFLFSDFGKHVIEELYYKKKNQNNNEKNNEKNNEINLKNEEKKKENESIEIEYCKLSHFFNVPFENFDKKTNKIIFHIFALIQFEKYKKLGKNDKEIDHEEFHNFCRKYTFLKNDWITEIAKMYKVSFSPSCSIMGGVTSQEIRKFVSKQHESIPNFCVFDMNQNVVCTSMIS